MAAPSNKPTFARLKPRISNGTSRDSDGSGGEAEHTKGRRTRRGGDVKTRCFEVVAGDVKGEGRDRSDRAVVGIKAVMFSAPLTESFSAWRRTLRE